MKNDLQKLPKRGSGGDQKRPKKRSRKGSDSGTEIGRPGVHFEAPMGVPFGVHFGPFWGSNFDSFSKALPEREKGARRPSINNLARGLGPRGPLGSASSHDL